MTGGHAWAGGACVAGRKGHVWAGGCAWQGGMHATHAPLPDTMRYGRSMRGRYASYLNAFLLSSSICTNRKWVDVYFNFQMMIVGKP